MGKKTAKKKKQSAQTKKKEAAKPVGNHTFQNDVRNFVPASSPGCHVASMDSRWIVGVDRFCEEDFGSIDEAPDMSVDPMDGLLTFINSSSVWRSYNVSTGLRAFKENGQELQRGIYSQETDEGVIINKDCVTFVAVLSPRTIMDVCFLQPDANDEKSDETGIDLQSDVKDLIVKCTRKSKTLKSSIPSPIAKPANTSSNDISTFALSDTSPSMLTNLISSHADSSSTSTSRCANVQQPKREHESVPVYGFPLARECGPYLCTQGFNGAFTHYFPGTLHAIDLACPPGTPVLAIADGEVVSVEQSNAAGGVHVSLLYSWNSIMLKLNDGYFVEYVHIQKNSARVAVGDRVSAGDVICLSGSVGFCPSPHLHLQVHKSDDPGAETVMFALKGKHWLPYVPVANNFYTPDGPLDVQVSV
eukprot:CFRG1402T1